LIESHFNKKRGQLTVESVSKPNKDFRIKMRKNPDFPRNPEIDFLLSLLWFIKLRAQILSSCLFNCPWIVASCCLCLLIPPWFELPHLIPLLIYLHRLAVVHAILLLPINLVNDHPNSLKYASSFPFDILHFQTALFTPLELLQNAQTPSLIYTRSKNGYSYYLPQSNNWKSSAP
jgi:hypothetical protein